MMKALYLSLAGMVLVSANVADPGITSSAPSIVVEGALPRTGTFNAAQLTDLGEVNVAWPTGDAACQWTGVPLSAVLAHLGLEPDKEVCDGVDAKSKRPGLRTVLLVTARDGYQAVFSIAELFEAFGSGQMFLVWKKDGQSLDEQEGPFRILATEDKKPSRCVFQVAKLTIVDLASTPSSSK